MWNDIRMDAMSESQFEFEYNNYDEEFYDDVSADENQDDDSGMEEKLAGRNSYDTDTDVEITNNHTPKTISHTKKGNSKLGAREKKTVLRNSDPYKSCVTSTSRRAQSDPHYSRKPKRPPGNKVASAKPMVNNSATQNNVAMKRVLSATRKKTSTLHNIIYELQQQCESLTIENRDLKRNVRVQDRDLRKLDGAEAQLPMLMKRHSNEMKVLQDKFKKQKEISTNLTENIKRVDIELLKTKDKLKEYQSIVKEKNLGERIELRNNILNLEKVIEEKECKISELNRNMALQKKAHSRMIKEKNDKYENVVKKVNVLEEIQNELVSRIKDREKALEISNIYSRRKQKDGKEMVMFSPQDSKTPIPKCIQLIQTDPKLLITEKNEEETHSIKSSIGDRVDTMVSRNGEHIGPEVLNVHTEEIGTTFLTEGTKETEDFYSINDGKEILLTNKDNSIYTSKKESSNATTNIDSLGEEKLHEKLDQMNEKGDTNEIMEVSKEQGILRREEIVNERDGSKAMSLQLEKMEFVNKKDNIRIGDKLTEETKARKLLLAKINAIDNGKNPNDVTETTLNLTDRTNENKSNKKPIFLESSVKSNTHDSPTPKLLDTLTSSNAKPNVGSSKARRNRHAPDSQSGSEDDSYMKGGERKNSWEFKKTDENLHRGLPSHTDILPSHQTDINNNFLNNLNVNKNRVNAGKYKDEINTPRYDTNYSPTVLDTNIGHNRKTKRNDVNLFDQFEDPFKDEYPKQGPNFKSARKKDESTELFSRTNMNSQTPDPVIIDDLEEMFIL